MPKQELVNYASRLTPQNHERLKAYATQNNVSANTAINALLDWALQTVSKKEWGISVNMGIEQSRKPRQSRQKSAPQEEPITLSGQMKLPTTDTQGVKCARCGTVNDGYKDGYFRCTDCEFGNYEPTNEESDTQKSLDECESHQDLIIYAAQNDKPRTWAFGQAKKKGFYISLSVTEQDAIWDSYR